MSIPERIILANKKNRVNQSQLVTELYRIEREKRDELRMHNTATQRFKAKYSKFDLFREGRGSEASDVRMYETHNPGFCYRRNGECRIPQSSSATPSVDFEDIHELLFTDGEVDIEKVLCLHLLSAHKTESLTPPPKSYRTISFLAKEQSPLERLIERSKRRRPEDTLTKMLPTYVLDVEKEDKLSLIDDGRLAARIIINDKIVQLVHTVMAALQKSNPEKMRTLLEMASNPVILQGILDKPEIQEFLEMLTEQSLISSCESFRLTVPFKAKTVPFEVKSPTEGLEQLVQHIRKNVLQIPSQNVWKSMYQKSLVSGESDRSVDAPKRKKHAEPKPKHIHGDKTPVNPKPEPTRKATSAVNPSSKLKPMEMVIAKNYDRSFGHDEIEIASYSNDARSETMSNAGSFLIAGATATEKMMMSDIRNLATLLDNKMKAANKRDRKLLNAIIDEEEEKEHRHERKLIGGEKIKVSLKQTTCPACLEKWRTPLPSPKTSTIKKKTVPLLDPETDKLIKTSSAHRLSILIDQEIDKLNRTNFVKSDNRNVAPCDVFKEQAKLLKNISVDSVDLDDLDLAKIRQEIREKETHKKLKKFLSERI